MSARGRRNPRQPGGRASAHRARIARRGTGVRRGFALLVALWLVVVITVAGLELGLEAREHRALGVEAADHGIAQAAAMGGLAIARSRLERSLRQLRTIGSNTDQLRASDPWLDADSLFADSILVGDVAVQIHTEDLGAKLNLNMLNGTRLRDFISVVLENYDTADALAQRIIDWRDADDLPQARGGERAQYLAWKRIRLPANRDFREVEELGVVEGVTPAILAKLRPYLCTRGFSPINVNSAPRPVLRAIPGMTDAIVTRILALRSQGRRLTGPADILTGVPAAQAQSLMQTILSGLVTFTTADLEVTVTATPPYPAHPLTVREILHRNGNNSDIAWPAW